PPQTARVQSPKEPAARAAAGTRRTAHPWPNRGPDAIVGIVRGDATVLHADLDAFYASVEQRDDPRLRGRPAILGGGAVRAGGYEARASGVRAAMRGGRARRLGPHAIVVPPRMRAYAEARRAVFEVFERTTPLVEGLSIDEACLDVRGLERVSGTPVQIA